MVEAARSSRVAPTIENRCYCLGSCNGFLFAKKWEFPGFIAVLLVIGRKYMCNLGLSSLMLRRVLEIGICIYLADMV